MKNQKHILVPAGRWKIVNFTYASVPASCMCCGRPIHYVLHMQNEDHANKVKVDPDYLHPEVIQIGRVCGPDVFRKSTIGFYENPDMEWCRQYRVFKDYIDYVVLCVRNMDIWESLPKDISAPVDHFLEEGYKKHTHTGPWWFVRDAKRNVLRTKRAGEKKLPEVRVMRYTARRLLTVAKSVQLIPVSWELTDDIELIKHEEQA